MRTIKYQDFFDFGGDAFVDGCFGEVGQHQHRIARLLCDRELDLLQQQYHLLPGGVAEIQEKDLLPGMLDELDALRHGN
jgi:hypothetical protein